MSPSFNRARAPIFVLCLLVGALPALADVSQEGADRRLVIFAAASLGPAVEEAAQDFGERSRTPIYVSVAASAQLARQIAQGAPADLFISADRRWIRFLSEGAGLTLERISPVAENRLVLAARCGTPSTGHDLTELLLSNPGDRIAIADPDMAPLGAYTKEALMALGLWGRLSNRLVPAPNARAALAFLDSGTVPMAILYSSDASAARNAQIRARIDPLLHRPIVYFAAVLRGSPHLTAFLEDLLEGRGRDTLSRHGLGPPSRSTDRN